MDLNVLGWNPLFDRAFRELNDDHLVPARVAREDRLQYLLYASSGELTGQITGRMRHEAASRADLPAVGDWVAIEARPDEGRASIHALLPRRSAFMRKVAGSVTEQQVVAANVDTVFLVNSLEGRDLSPRRLERYLTMAWESGAEPVVLLNKADVCDDITARRDEVEMVALGVPVLALSALEGAGLDKLAPYLRPGQTVALLGSSGVGKSTIINALLGEQRLVTAAVRADDGMGRHTTTHRELVPLPSGAILVDTPGMREMQLWSSGEGLSATFDDVESLAAQCRFPDCRHEQEPGCAVRQALLDGDLDEERYRGWQKLQRELHHLQLRQDDLARRLERDDRKRWNRTWRKERQSNPKHRV